MLARDVMHTHVITAGPDTSLGDVASLMVRHQVEGLPIVDDDRNLVGLISAMDFLRMLRPNPVRFLDVNLYLAAGRVRQALVHEIAELRAADVMTRCQWSVTSETPLDKIVGLMGEHDVRHVPVLEDGRVVGVIHRIDVVRLFTDWLSEEVVSD